MENPAENRASDPKLMVLFLEDNPGTRALYPACFRRHGFSVLTSTHGTITLRLAKTHPVKIAVVDYDACGATVFSRQVRSPLL